MTHSGGQPHTNVGDKGQQFEITYLDPDDNTRKVFGWATTSLLASKMCDSVHLHPSMRQPLVRDRYKEKK